MKCMSTLIFSCLLYFTASSQQWKVIANYSAAIPQQQMGKNIQTAHSMQAGALYQLPKQLKHFAVGLELGIGLYAHEAVNQTFQFDNNVSAIVPVDYTSNVFNVNLQTRYNLLDEKKYRLVPYINAKGGLYNFFSNINIEDPNDPSGCRPLDKKSIINDKTLYWSAGAGLQINPIVFSKNAHPSRVMVDISAHVIRGGRVSYINTKHLMHEHDMPMEEGKPLNVKFINVNTQAIHEHTVAQVFTTPLRMIEVRGGLTIRIGKGWQ